MNLSIQKSSSPFYKDVSSKKGDPGRDHIPFDPCLTSFRKILNSADPIANLVSCTAFDKREVKLIYRNFKQVHHRSRQTTHMVAPDGMFCSKRFLHPCSLFFFLQDCPDGLITPDILKNIYIRFFPCGSESKEKSFFREIDFFPFPSVSTFRLLFERFPIFEGPGLYTQHVFRTMDKKKLGKITFKEFLVWLSEISHGTLGDKIAWTFRLYDTNEDGSICSEDLFSIIKSIYFLMGKRKDADDDELVQRKVDLFFEVGH